MLGSSNKHGICSETSGLTSSDKCKCNSPVLAVAISSATLFHPKPQSHKLAFKNQNLVWQLRRFILCCLFSIALPDHSRDFTCVSCALSVCGFTVSCVPLCAIASALRVCTCVIFFVCLHVAVMGVSDEPQCIRCFCCC